MFPSNLHLSVSFPGGLEPPRTRTQDVSTVAMFNTLAMPENPREQRGSNRANMCRVNLILPVGCGMA